jgi:integrase
VIASDAPNVGNGSAKEAVSRATPSDDKAPHLRGNAPCGAGDRGRLRLAYSSAWAKPSPVSTSAPALSTSVGALRPDVLALALRQVADGLAPHNGNGQDGEAIPDNFIADLGGASNRRPTMRAYGPYREDLRKTTRYRVVVREKQKKDRVLFFRDESAARAEVRQVNRAAAIDASPTVAEAMQAYQQHQTEAGNRPTSIRRTMLRLNEFFGEVIDSPVIQIGATDCERLYTNLRLRRTKRGTLIAPDSQLNALGSAKTFTRWLAKKRYTKVDVLADVEAVGRRRKGKKQLTTNEGRLFLAKALELASMGDVGATAAATALLLGLRASEVVGRSVRDLDADGAILNVTASKTATGIRRLEVPAALRPHLKRLAEGRAADALLFGGKPPKTQGRKRRRASRPLEWSRFPDRWLLSHVHRICDLASVPRVCTHALRGQHSSEAVAAGATGHLVAAALGHASFATTKAHYLRPEALASARTRRVELALLPVETTDAPSVSTTPDKAAQGA